MVTNSTRELKVWPKSARSLSGKLRTLAPNLRAVGIIIEGGRTSGSGSKRLVKIRKEPEICDASDASGTDMEFEIASHLKTVPSHPTSVCSASEAGATQSDVGDARIPTRSEAATKTWEEHL
jgi:hypothetical protein